jgi:transcriptional regulator with XRE-family HTH domain
VTASVDDQVTAAELNEYVGWHLRSARLHAGMSQKDLAVLLRKKVTTISAWETGSTAVSLADLFEVARVFEVPVTAFIPRSTS